MNTHDPITAAAVTKIQAACCFPGCLPEGDAVGPFGSALAALRDAYDNEYIGAGVIA